MDDLSSGYEWAKTHNFDETDLHLCTIMALNILDGATKNDYDSLNVLMAVYDGIAERIPSPFDKKVHQIIELSRSQDPIYPKEEYKEVIHNLREASIKSIDIKEYEEFEQFVWDQIT